MVPSREQQRERADCQLMIDAPMWWRTPWPDEIDWTLSICGSTTCGAKRVAILVRGLLAIGAACNVRWVVAYRKLQMNSFAMLAAGTILILAVIIRLNPVRTISAKSISHTYFGIKWFWYVAVSRRRSCTTDNLVICCLETRRQRSHTHTHTDSIAHPQKR